MTSVASSSPPLPPEEIYFGRSWNMATDIPLPQPASIDEHLSSFDSIPLFMRSLPSETTTGEGATALDALQSLIHEGTPDGESCITSTVTTY